MSENDKLEMSSSSSNRFKGLGYNHSDEHVLEVKFAFINKRKNNFDAHFSLDMRRARF